MKVIVPYNEILPTKKAHDVYLFNLCRFLAGQGAKVDLVCGKGSLAPQKLFRHYGNKENPQLSLFYLPILRKNNPLGISWNRIFFSASQKYIKRHCPDIVHLSVLKQGYFQLKRKIPSIRYLYEAHELACYGNTIESPFKFAMEKYVFNNADLVIVTTHQLRKILLNPPYCIKTRIEVLPLAVNTQPLPLPKKEPLKLGYIGQLYAGQGIDMLLQAMKHVPMWNLQIIGGTQEELIFYKSMAEKLGIQRQIEFLGFCSPQEINTFACACHAFVAPFANKGRMPFVAHTKLYEYAQMGRPIIAPDLPIVKEHFPQEKGIYLFNPEDPTSLAKALGTLSNQKIREKLQQEILGYRDMFTWENRAVKYLAMTT